ncbi:hypothetical protein [Candidatus Pollutiaquabacter sp.]|uniref:hypothetical protein n=1 Tax=Candidatus Pollutiaquabacter sp. TaxID=3416354 RepID=UPI003CAFE841|nr:hypothetical protein [Bacteroidota bacterium]
MKSICTFFLLAGLLLAAMVSAQTTRRVVIEEFTGAWCGACPDAAIKIEEIEHDYPDNTIGLAWHEWDDLEIPEWTPVKTLFGVSSYPGGAVDRYKFAGASRIILSHLSFRTRFLNRYNTPAIVSVGMRDLSFDGAAYHFTVDANFSAAPHRAPLARECHHQEDSIPAVGSLEQHNYYSTIQNGNNPLVNWYHNEAIRRCLGGPWGVTGGLPPVAVTGITYSSDFSFIPDPSWNLDQLHLVAIVTYDGDTSLNQKEILNAETVRLRDWMLSTNLNTPSPAALNATWLPIPFRVLVVPKSLTIYPSRERSVTSCSINSASV